jgi:hypothetical protein
MSKMQCLFKCSISRNDLGVHYDELQKGSASLWHFAESNCRWSGTQVDEGNLPQHLSGRYTDE